MARLVFALSGAARPVACRDDAPLLTVAEVHTRLSTVCAEHRAARAAGPQAVAGPTFSTDTFDVYDIIDGDALDTIDTIRAPAELQDSVDALHDEIELLR